jgi:hypothetical protein
MQYHGCNRGARVGVHLGCTHKYFVVRRCVRCLFRFLPFPHTLAPLAHLTLTSTTKDSKKVHIANKRIANRSLEHTHTYTHYGVYGIPHPGGTRLAQKPLLQGTAPSSHTHHHRHHPPTATQHNTCVRRRCAPFRAFMSVQSSHAGTLETYRTAGELTGPLFKLFPNIYNID